MSPDCRFHVLATAILFVVTSGTLFESLAPAGPPTNNEQYFIELINRDRADPVGAAKAYGIDLNEGLPAGTISSAPKQPLAINTAATTAIHDFVEYLRVNGLFTHTGAGGSTPGTRMATAGYAPAGTFSWGENLAYTVSTLPLNITAQIANLNKLLFVDAGIDGRGHRVNMLNDGYTEAGSGVSIGPYTPPAKASFPHGLLIGNDFGNKFDGPYFTGVAYDDISSNDIYEPGEGLGSITVVATNQSTKVQYAATTWASGGYSLKVPTGVYDVVAYGGGLGGTVLDADITIASKNIKFDFLPDEILDPGDADGNGLVDGGDYTTWADNYLEVEPYHNATTGDLNGNGVVDGGDYTVWADNFAPAAFATAVPEPTTWVLAICGILLAVAMRIHRVPHAGESARPSL